MEGLKIYQFSLLAIDPKLPLVDSLLEAENITK